MPRFNVRAVSKMNTPPDTTNLAGGQAYLQDTKQEVVGLLLTSFLTDEHYRSGNDTIARLRELIRSAPIDDIPFIAKATVLARSKYGMRSVTHLAAAEIVRRMSQETYKARAALNAPAPPREGFDKYVRVPFDHTKLHTPEWVRRFVNLAIHRVDDAAEMVSAYLANYGKPIPHAMLRGIRDNLGARSPYALAKYRGESRGLKLVDLVRLTHPNPSTENQEAFAALVKGTLTSTETWESKLTRAGQVATTDEEKADLKGAAWKELIQEKKIGYFALLRNLRNIAQQAPDQLDDALTLLQDENLIRKSLVLPFRYSTAYREFNRVARTGNYYEGRLSTQPRDGLGLDGDITRKISVALSGALDISLANVPIFEGKTVVWLDNSGSMQGDDPKAPIWIGAVFAAVLAKANLADVGTFSDSARLMNYNPQDSTLTIAEKLMQSSTPAGTNFNAIFQAMNRPYDRIIILSDMMGWMSDQQGLYGDDYNYYAQRHGGAPTKTYQTYRQTHQANPWIYSFDLRNYGTMQFDPKNPKVFMIGGFASEIFRIMGILEGDRDALIKEIESVEL